MKLAGGALVLAVVAFACAGSGEGTPQIAVSPDAAERMCRLFPARCGITKDAGPNLAGKPARVHPMRAGEELGGPNATGRPGDWMLENDEVAFVVDGLGGGGGFAESGGNLVDAADARVRKDALGQLFTYFGVFPRQAVYEAIEARTEQGVAVLEARGRELHEKDLAVRTEYRLGPTDRALLVRTTIENRGGARLVLPGLGDAVQWGGTEKVAPGKPLGFKGASKGPFIGGVGRFTSYALTSTEGDIGAISGGAWSDTTQVGSVALEPGARVAYERVLVVGERPDLASVVAELVKSSGEPVAGLEITLRDARGVVVPAPAGAKVLLGTGSGEPVLSLVAAGGSFRGEIPPGKWVVSFAPSVGRGAPPGSVPVTVTARAGEVAKATLSVTDARAARLGPCLEEGLGLSAPREVACKIVLEGLAGAKTPDFGPGHVAGPAKDQVILRAGEVLTVPLAGGRYRLTASRGPEDDLATAEVDVTAGDAASGALRLRRVVDTAGYVATDFHQHTILSADAPVATRDRVIANAAEGVEVAVASEHNNVVDLAPVVREAGLAALLVSISGDELTTDASRKPWGHANVYPLAVKADEARGGAFPVRDRSPRDVFAEARALPGARVIQVNHPRSGANGYFDQLGFDAKTGRASSPEYAEDFDALEVWNGRNVDARGRVLEDFFALLRTGKVVTAIADTDTHGIVGQEPGYPRTYVRVKDDAHLEAWDEARTADLVHGVRGARDVVLTNGPFLAVTANGAPIGGTAVAKGGKVEIDVEVRSASWVAVEALEIRLAGRSPGAKVLGPREAFVTPSRDARTGALVARARFSIAVGGVDAFVVVARGSKPMRPVLAGEDAEIAPWAMTGAVWVRPPPEPLVR